MIDTGLNPSNKKDSTIVRMLIDIQVFAAVTGQRMRVAMGVTLMNADAHAAGALPEPGRNNIEDADWLWLIPQTFMEVALGTTPNKSFILDIRAKRKYNSNQDLLVFVIDNQDATNAVNIGGSIRTLILDPP